MPGPKPPKREEAEKLSRLWATRIMRQKLKAKPVTAAPRGETTMMGCYRCLPSSKD